MAKTDTNENSPYIKEHEGKTICFADTIGQAISALKRENVGKEGEKLADGHLMLFGVEKWSSGDLKAMTGAMKAPTNDFSRLEVFGCEMSASAQVEFAGALENLEKVKVFDLDNTVLEAKGAQAIFTRIAQAHRIERLNLQGSLTKAGVVAEMSMALCTDEAAVFKSLKDIDLKINDIKGNDGNYISDIMMKLVPNDVVKVDLFYNNLSAAGADFVATALAKGCMVTHLDLCCNSIGDKGAESIADALRTNDKLHTLKLALNNIGNSGAVALLKAVTTTSGNPTANKTLKNLDISANIININYKETKKQHKEEAAQREKLCPEMKEKLKEIEKEFGPLSDEALEQGLLILDREEELLADAMGEQKVLAVLCTVLANNNLDELDFTGIEMDNDGWAYFASTLPSLLKLEKKANIKFSIVDCMNEQNLKTLEDVIWKDDKESFSFLDWRRKDTPTEEKK